MEGGSQAKLERRKGSTYRPLVQPLESRTKSIIGAAYEVHNLMGHGLMERVYEKSLEVELGILGHRVERQVKVQAHYKGVDVGYYIADMVVDSTVVVELKCVSSIVDPHRRQVLNYLRSLEMPVGLVLNFGPERVQVARVVQWDLMTAKEWR